MLYQRDLLLDAYKVPDGSWQPQARRPQRSWSTPQVPVLPAVGGQRGGPSARELAGVITSSPGGGALKLPMLPNSQITAAEALAMAAATASENAAAAADEVSARLGMKRSKSSVAVPSRRRQRARTNILQLMSLATVEPPPPEGAADKSRHQKPAGEAGLEKYWHDSDLRRQWEWECRYSPATRKLNPDMEDAPQASQREGSVAPPPPKPRRAPPKPAGKETMQEFYSLREITKTAQQICTDLTKKRQSDGELSNGPRDGSHVVSPRSGRPQKSLGRQARKKWDSEEKAEFRAAADAEVEKWRRATLAAVPEADVETKTEAEQRKRQQDERRQEEAAAKSCQVSSFAEDGAERPAEANGGEGQAPAAAASASSGRAPKSARDNSNFDELYGLPSLAGRLEQVQNVMFGKGELMEEASVQRLRVVFNRFRTPSGNEVLKEDLSDIVQFLGFVVPSEQELQDVAGQVSTFKEMDFNDFLAFIEKFSQISFERYRVMFAAFDVDGSGEIAVSELRKLLLKIGFVVVRQMLEEALEMVDADGNGELDFNEFIRFLTVYNHAEGFTREDVKGMWNIYDGFVSETVKFKKGKGLLCKDLADALVAVFGLRSEKHAVRLGKRLLTNAAGQQRNEDASNGLSFHEFLIFSRRLREAEQEDYKAQFIQFDQDQSGSINAVELQDVLKSLGYKPMRAVITEVLQEVDFEADADLDFEEFFHFILVFRKRDGFTLKELEQYRLVFNKYDEDMSDNVNVHELGNMLRFLGFSVGNDDLHILVSEVDVNKNGLLDINEFLRLMRLHRESDLKRLQEIFDRHSGKEVMLQASMIFAAVQESLDEESPSVHVMEATEGKTSDAIDFEDFVALADQAHWTRVVAERRMAGFSEAELKTLEDMFGHYDKDGSGDIDSFEVQDLLDDFGLSCKTRAERQATLDQMETAKKLAREAGVSRDERKSPVNTMMTFWELVQLVRLVKTERAKQQEEHNKKIIEELRFSKQEMDDFRLIFLSWSRTGGTAPVGGSSGAGRRVSLIDVAAGNKASDPEDLEEELASLPVAMFLKLLKSGLGLTITQALKQQLEDKVSSSADTVGNGDISFVGFLQMLRWMLDSNFAGINRAAQKAAANSQQEYFANEISGR